MITFFSLCVEDISTENVQRWDYPDTCKGAKGKMTVYFILTVSRLMRASSTILSIVVLAGRVRD